MISIFSLYSMFSKDSTAPATQQKKPNYCYEAWLPSIMSKHLGCLAELPHAGYNGIQPADVQARCSAEPSGSNSTGKLRAEFHGMQVYTGLLYGLFHVHVNRFAQGALCNKALPSRRSIDVLRNHKLETIDAVQSPTMRATRSKC